MATTYTLITSNTVASATATITLSSIPSIYTDLCLKISGRTDISAYYYDTYFTFNNDSGSNYSAVNLRADSNSAYSNIYSNLTSLFRTTYVDGANATSNTFGNMEMYIPSYTASINKQISVTSVTENNDASTWRNVYGANLWRNNAAISSIEIVQPGNFSVGTSIWLYGIKNS